MKAVWIREDRVLSDDYQAYLHHLREKYGVTEQNSSTGHKIKGVGQLARILKVLSDEDFQKKNKEFSQVQTVYPILLVYDVFLTAPVYGNFLASEFEKLLIPDQKLDSGELIKGNFRIHPLIVMTIEDLENLELSIKHFNFIDLLSDYSKECQDRLMSLKNYIAGSKYNNQIYRNKNLANKCLELFKETKAAIELRRES